MKHQVELTDYLASVVRQEPDAIVICDLSHEIVYMNPAAQRRYQKRGGAALVGQSVMNCHNERSRKLMQEIVAFFEKDAANNIVYLGYRPKIHEDLYMIALRDADGKLIGYYEKHALRTRDAGEAYAALHAEQAE